MSQMKFQKYLFYFSFFREANQLSAEMKKDSEFAVTLQVNLLLRKFYVLCSSLGNDFYG